MKNVKFTFGFLLSKGYTPHRGVITLLPLSSRVEVFQDGAGIPHIFAENEHDLMKAQGFLHARDRLWQMESIRRIASARLAEVAGEEAVDMDHFSLLAGLPTLRKRALEVINDEQRELLKSYASGINAFLEIAGKNLPLEFRTLGFIPEPWEIDDLYSSLVINAWFLQTNYLEELLAILSRKKLTIHKWNEIFPSYPKADLPEEDFFERYRDIKIGTLLPAAVAFYNELSPSNGGSNNWVSAKGEGGLPLLANDPHLGMYVPQTWYICHLHCPTLNVCGVSLSGLPGIIIGRNEHVAWGFTNVMTDIVDLFVIKVDPKNPTLYFVKDKEYRMEKEEASISIAGGKQKDIVIYHTVYGPVITVMDEGVEAVVALKWYGTLSEAELKDTTISGLLSINRARGVKEVFEAGRLFTAIGQNIVAADAQGHIGVHATGAVPLRSGFSGRLPADGSSGKHGWTGFLSYDELLNVIDPPAGWIATANHKTVDSGSPNPITYSWCAPYRYDRIASLLQDLKNPVVEDFNRIQMDIHSLQAERMLPTILSYSYTDPLAREAIDILDDWDMKVKADSCGALVFNVFIVQMAYCLLLETLGENIHFYLLLMTFLYTVIDEILQKGKESLLLLDTPFSDRGTGALCEEALARAIRFISQTLGKNRGRWEWGKLHRFYYKHPGAKGRLASWLLNRGPYPSSGCQSTVNVSLFRPGRKGPAREQYETVVIPSMRMITSLSHPDKTFIIGPMGQSGQPGHKHYDDMIHKWIQGMLVPLPLTREGVKEVTVDRLELRLSKCDL